MAIPKEVFLLFLGISFYACNSYQRIDYNASSADQKELSNEKVAQNKAACRRILYEYYSKYVDVADFKGKDGQVTMESVLDFKELFEPNARVWNDIMLYEGDPRLIDANYYADLVFTYLTRNGVRTELEKPNINEFFSGVSGQFEERFDNVSEDDDIYFYTYKTTKKNYNILNKNNQELNYDEPMIYNIEITFRISVKNQNARIVSIYPDKDKYP